VLVKRQFGIPVISDLPEPGLGTLLVVGGGSRMDRAKLWRTESSPKTRLILIPSLWGSGAEASPIVALNVEDGKLIRMGPQYLPDHRAIWPELMDSIPEEQVRQACGDSWSHALEGFLSPLAVPAVQAELAEVIRGLTVLPLGKDARWFEASARACAGQAKAGVGLTHGIAHTLEGPLAAAKHRGWGHARLCTTYLYPVMAYNLSCNQKWPELATRYGLDRGAVDGKLKELFDEQGYRETLPFLQAEWSRVLRDPSSRANSALVRPAALDFFLKMPT
jgi:alcohol dehydrogenase class IV